MSHYVVDLFAGAGGLTEGFKLAGFSSVLAIDFDEQAMETFHYNHPEGRCVIADIRQLDDATIEKIAGDLPGEIDVICGGPPCQSFSLAGPRLADDPRNKLFLEFAKFAEIIRPKVILFENVPGITTMQKGKALDAIEYEFTKIGYECRHQILNAADYGVPQMRPRFILLGLRGGGDITFPTATHKEPEQNTQPLFDDENGREPYITVWEALSDLPLLQQGEGAEELEHLTCYENEYQRFCRGTRRPGAIYNHRATRHSKRIQERYAMIPEGCNNSVLPPEIRTKKRNAFKLDRDAPARTVTCNFRTDLLHPIAARGITVREAARMQSFSDDYRFFGNLTRKAKWVTQDDQVGNSVPPNFAKALAEHILNVLIKQVE